MKKTIILSILLAVCTVSLQAAAASREKEPVEPFDRGIGRSTSVFIPAGTIGAGASFSYSNYSLGNGINDTGYQMLFSLIQNLHGNLPCIRTGNVFSLIFSQIHTEEDSFLPTILFLLNEQKNDN